MNRLFCYALCLLYVTANAQNPSAPVSSTLDAYWNFTPVPTPAQAVLLLSETTLPGPTSTANTILLEQNGVGNRANLQTLAGSANRLEVSQTSDGNVVNAVLSGTSNGLLFSQTGGGNQINFGLYGTGNRFMLTQDGGDVANLQGLNQSGTRLELSQGAGNNSFSIDNSTLFKDPLSTGIPNLRIEQTGGAAVTIQSGRLIGN